MKRRLFNRKQYHNPFVSRLSRRDQNDKFSKKPMLRIPKVIYLGFFIVGLFILSYASAFQIEVVEVQGAKRTNPDQIENLIFDQTDNRRFLFFRQSSIFLFSKRQAAEAVADNFLVDTVKVKKNYFNTITVVIAEKQSGVAWVSNNQQYYLDLAGSALREIQFGQELVVAEGGANTDVIRSELASGDFPVVYDLSHTQVVVGQPVTTAELINFVLGIFDELSLVADFGISHFNIERPFSREVTLITKDGWEARFKIDEDPVVQSGILMSVLQQKVQDRNNLQYIDLRYGDRVFYQ